MAETRVQEKRPVLLVGLGGTGKQVLINLRRKIFEAYGEPLYPYIGNVMIDTDARSLTLEGKEYDYLSRMVDFDASELVDVELNMSDVAKIRDHHADYPHIHSWFDQRLFVHGEISNGAAQIRSFGRLAFFMNYPEIMDRIGSQIASLQSMARANPMLEDLNIRVDANVLDVWIVFSVAGGTGSGMFLDVAFAIKEKYPNANIRGILVLPTLFSQEFSERIFANGYSALMELEHYNLDRSALRERTAAEEGTDAGLDDIDDWFQESPHKFPAAWTLEQYTSGKRLSGPVFQSTLLVDNKPRGTGGTIQIDQKNALCDMLAEYLFVEYGLRSEPLADSFRSARSNFAGALQAILEARYDDAPFPLRENFCCLYGSLGLAKLHVPIDRITSLVQHRLAHDILGNWVRENSVPSDFTERSDIDVAPRLMLSENRKSRSIPREIVGIDNTRPITEQITQLVSEKRSDALSRAAVPSIGEEIQEWVQLSLMRDQLDCNAPAQADWGRKSRALLITNVDKLVDRLKQEIDQILEETLAEPSQRFALARATLRRAHERYSKQAVDFDQKKDARRNAAQRDARDANDRLEWLRDCGGTFTRRKILSVVFEFIESQAIREVEAQAFQASAEVCRRMADHIGAGTMQKKKSTGAQQLVETGLIKQLSDLEALLSGDVQRALENRVKALEQAADNPINVNLFEPGDIEAFYRLNDGRAIDAGTVRDLDRRFFEEAPANRYPSLWSMRETVHRLGAERLLNDLLAFAGRQTRRHLEGEVIHAIDRLGRRHKPSEPQFQNQGVKLLQHGNPWLEHPTHHWLNEQASNTIRTARYVAMAQDDESDANLTFRDILKRQSEVPPQFVDSTPDRLYVATETAGQPLMAIPNLDRYRDNAYRPLIRKDAIHGDYHVDKFADIIPMRPEEAKAYKYVLRAVAFGLLMGVLTIRAGRRNGGGRQMTVSMVNQTDIGLRDEDLGPLSVAIWQLSQPGSRRRLKQIDEAVHSQRDTWGLAEHARFVALLYHNGRNSEVIPDDLAQAMTAIAKEEANRQQQVKTEANRQLKSLHEWAQERPADSGLYILKQDAEAAL
jgi:hypothetical protein